MSLDYLRAFCMIYIVGYWHLFDYTQAFPAWKNTATYVLSLMVLGIFVTISGFLVGISGKKSNNFLKFYKSRFIRIYLLYGIAIGIFYAYGMIGTTTALKSLVFMSMIDGPPPTTLWFINMLGLFYLATPLLLLLAQNPARYFLLVVGTTMTLLLFVKMTTVDERLPWYFPSFCIGIFCAQHGINNHKESLPLIALSLACWGFLSWVHIDPWIITPLKNIAMIVSCTYLIFIISYLNEDRFTPRKIISFISYSSFSMYLFHRPIYITLKHAYFPESSKLQILYLLIVGFPLVAGISWGIQKLYDFGYKRYCAQ